MKFLLAVCVLLVKPLHGQEHGQPYQFRLLNDILNKDTYDPRVRPVRNVHRPVHVKLRIALYQIIEVVDVAQTIILNAWVTQYWRDEYLGWMPVTYGNLDRVMLPPSAIWTPDTYLYNNLQMDEAASQRTMPVIVKTNNSAIKRPFADIEMLYPAKFEFSCLLHVQWFPFDTQNCTLIFGSWTYDIKGINYTSYGDAVEMDNYVSNAEWTVLAFNWKRIEVNYDCCPNNYVMLHANLVLQRKPLFYLVNLILPTFIISIVSIFGFFVPSEGSGERQEKVNLGISTLMAMVILLIMVVEQMPATSDLIPLMGWYYLIVILLISSGTLITVFVISMQSRADYGMRASRFVALPMFRIGRCIGIPVSQTLRKAWKDDKIAQAQSTVGNQGFDLSDETASAGGDKCTEPMMQYSMNEIVHNSNGTKQCVTCGSTNQDGMDTDMRKLIRREWQFIADTVDRLMLVLFLSAFVLLTLGVLVAGQWAQAAEQQLLIGDSTPAEVAKAVAAAQGANGTTDFGRS